MTVKYLTQLFPDAEFMWKPPKAKIKTAWGTWYPGQSLEGYGAKIVTDYMVKVPALSNRPLRVYATCFSNCASHWVLVKGEKYHLSDFDIPESVRNGGA